MVRFHVDLGQGMLASDSQLEMPAELQNLGEMRQLFEPSEVSRLAAYGRGLLSLVLGAGMIAAGETFLVPRTWKYYVLVSIGVLLVLNALRILIRALRRRRQKVAVF